MASAPGPDGTLRGCDATTEVKAGSAEGRSGAFLPERPAGPRLPEGASGEVGGWDRDRFMNYASRYERGGPHGFKTRVSSLLPRWGNRRCRKLLFFNLIFFNGILKNISVL